MLRQQKQRPREAVRRRQVREAAAGQATGRAGRSDGGLPVPAARSRVPATLDGIPVSIVITGVIRPTPVD